MSTAGNESLADVQRCTKPCLMNVFGVPGYSVVVEIW
jgi:hypothetical protein